MGDCRSCSHSRGLVTFYYRQVFAVAVAEATVRSRTRQQTTRRWRRLSQDAPKQTSMITLTNDEVGCGKGTFARATSLTSQQSLAHAGKQKTGIIDH